MSEITPEEVLEEFLYENIFNRHERYEDDGWRLSYITPNFLILDPDGNLHNIKVTFEEGDLTTDQMEQIVKDQEWGEIE
jgi:hypothetical protein